MGHRDIFSCDWCGQEGEAVSTFVPVQEVHGRIERNETLLCRGCWKLRMVSLLEAQILVTKSPSQRETLRANAKGLKGWGEA
jgi:hypothetical protein